MVCKFLFVAVLLGAVPVSVMAQREDIMGQVQQYTAFQSNNPQEKIYIHTDKEMYLVGELMWFRLYCNVRDSISKVAYVDLLDASGKTAVSAKISLKKNEDNGSLLLPLSLASGSYSLRVYTNWMKNNAEKSFFTKQLTVINPFKNPDTTLMQPTGKCTVQFFPEGGNLVKGLTSVVGVKVTDAHGKGVDATGYILNSNNEKVASFSTLKFGLGRFTLTPAETGYTAVVTTNGCSEVSQLMPKVMAEGYVMHVNDEADAVTITVTTSYTGPQELSVFAQSQQKIRYADAKQVSNGSVSFTISKSKLGEGVIQFTAFNSLRQPIAERLLFVKPSQATSLNAATDQAQYRNRSKVALGLQAKNTKGDATNTDLSVAVFPADSLQLSGNADIVSYFWLAADVKGYIESPAFYFSADPDASLAADNLMITQGWRRFSWSDVTTKPAAPIMYTPEVAGQLFQVRVTDAASAKPLADKEIFLSVTGAPFQLRTAVTDKDGIARFTLKEFYGTRKIIVQLNAADRAAAAIELLSPFYKSTGALPYTPQLRIPEHLEQYSINMQVQNIYNADSMRMFYERNSSDTLPFYGHAMYTYRLDDYTRFTTMEEVLREYVREINVVARNGGHYLRMLDEARHDVNENNLLVMWDGVPLTNPHDIFSMDPLKVRRLDVIPRKFAVGQLIFNGIASFQTYNNDLAGLTLNDQALNVNYEGMQLQREFYSPRYDTDAQLRSRMPDFRNTLYWAPNVSTTSKGATSLNFYTGDRKGKYIAVVQGMDANGRPVFSTCSFEVQ